MAYRVELARKAEADLEALYLWVVAQARSQGAEWFRGLERAILSLERLPKRCRLAPENFDSGRPIRVLNYGRTPHVYRVFFTVDDHTRRVHVLHIRRGTRRRPTRAELTGE